VLYRALPKFQTFDAPPVCIKSFQGSNGPDLKLVKKCGAPKKDPKGALLMGIISDPQGKKPQGLMNILEKKMVTEIQKIYRTKGLNAM